MRAAFAWSLAFALAAGLSVARAEEPALPLCASPDLASLPENPDGDPALRLATLARWQAEGATPNQTFRAGALYRMGKAHPAALVEADLQKARDLLAKAALAGELTAMASSAELELRHGDAFSGMVWAQLYAHYMQVTHPSRFRTYQADLIKRGFAALPPGEETERRIVAYVQGFFDKYGAGIDAALASTKDAGASPERDCRPVHEVYPVERRLDSHRVPLAGGSNTIKRARLHGPGLALFRLHVAPSGEVSQALVIESLPGPAAGKGLRASALRMRFNAVAEDAPIRVVYLPMTYDDQSVRVRD
ncbi:hypothetical protein [Arenimonas sp.]|uniref:hypothetical protein n=1 Tax=Arenimonas sp. TaxID=1872635 RepID=UPI0035ADF7E8